MKCSQGINSFNAMTTASHRAELEKLINEEWNCVVIDGLFTVTSAVAAMSERRCIIIFHTTSVSEPRMWSRQI